MNEELVAIYKDTKVLFQRRESELKKTFGVEQEGSEETEQDEKQKT